MVAVDQARVARPRRLDPRARGLGARVHRHRHHREGVGLQVFVEGLPDRQVVPAPSPRGPRHQQDLLATVIRQGVPAPLEIGEREVRRRERPQDAGALAAPRCRAPRPLPSRPARPDGRRAARRRRVDEVAPDELGLAAARHRDADVPRQSPSGLSSQPVARRTSALDTQKASPAAPAPAISVSRSSWMTVAMAPIVSREPRARQSRPAVRGTRVGACLPGTAPGRHRSGRV